MWRKRLRQHRHKPFLLMLAPKGTERVAWVQGDVLLLVFTKIKDLQHCIRHVHWWWHRRYCRGVVLAASSQACPAPEHWRKVLENVVRYRLLVPCWVWLYDVTHLPPDTAWLVPCHPDLLTDMQQRLAALRHQVPLRCQWYDSPQENSRIPAVVPNVLRQVSDVQQWLQQIWVKAVWQHNLPLQAVLLDAHPLDLKRHNAIVQACVHRQQQHGGKRWQKVLAACVVTLGLASLMWMAHSTQQQWHVWDNALLQAEHTALRQWQQQDAQLHATQWSFNYQPYALWHAAYQHRLLSTFLPNLLMRVHHALQTHPTFAALKLYLMFSTGKHLDIPWVMVHIRPYWQAQAKSLAAR